MKKYTPRDLGQIPSSSAPGKGDQDWPPHQDTRHLINQPGGALHWPRGMSRQQAAARLDRAINAELVQHDGATEWSVCRTCGRQIDWAQIDGDPDDIRCPCCGSEDTKWLRADAAHAAER